MEQLKENLPAISSQSNAVFNFFDPVQFETMQRVCKLFSSSELVPDMYRAVVKPIPANASENEVKSLVAENKAAESKAMANCMIAIEMSQRIGASPLMIMQNMVIIYGRPSWSSKFLIATVNTCGRFNPLKFRFASLGMVGKVSLTTFEKKWVPGVNGAKGKYESNAKITEFDGMNIENLQCIAYTTAKGSEEQLESSPVDIKLALQEGWYTKQGSKWQTMTRQMLMYRAASFWTNAYAPELSMGMKTEEEIRDIIDADYEDVTDKVENVKADNANKRTIKITPEPAEQAPEAAESKPADEKPADAAEAAAPAQEQEGPKENAQGTGTAGTGGDNGLFNQPGTGQAQRRF